MVNLRDSMKETQAIWFYNKIMRKHDFFRISILINLIQNYLSTQTID